MSVGRTQVELNEDGTEVELGKGAFGVVVKGSYRLAPVAIKRLRDQSPEQQVAFLKEMSILRACRGSRYVVPFVGASLQPVSQHLSPSPPASLCRPKVALTPAVLPYSTLGAKGQIGDAHFRCRSCIAVA